MSLRTLPRLLAGLAAIALVWGAAGADLPAQNPPAKTDPKKDDKKDDKKKEVPYEVDVGKLPLTRFWDLKELRKLGKIVDMRNETEKNNQVVWIVQVKEVPKELVLWADFQDDERGRLWSDRQVKINKLAGKDPKTDKEWDPPRIEVTVKLPPRPQMRKNTSIVVIRKPVG